MDILYPITPEQLSLLLASDDLNDDFINNKAYSKSMNVPIQQRTATDRSNINIINVAKVLLSYYMSMNTVKKMLSQYSSLLKNKLSPEKKADIELRVKLLDYVVSQKIILENVNKTQRLFNSGRKRRSRCRSCGRSLSRK